MVTNISRILTFTRSRQGWGWSAYRDGWQTVFLAGFITPPYHFLDNSNSTARQRGERRSQTTSTAAHAFLCDRSQTGEILENYWENIQRGTMKIPINGKSFFNVWILTSSQPLLGFFNTSPKKGALIRIGWLCLSFLDSNTADTTIEIWDFGRVSMPRVDGAGS